MFFAWRSGRDTAFWLITVLAAASLAFSEWGWRNEPDANFYFAPTRAWELLAGSMAAFIIKKHGIRSNNALACLGLSAILFAIFFYDKSTPFPSVYALVPVLGVVMLVLFADHDTYVAKLLSAKVFVGIGLISYSAYLWHQPLLAFARLYLDVIQPSTLAILSVASFAFAYLSWKFIEQPFRNKARFTECHIFVLSITFGAAFTAFGVVGNVCQTVYEEYWVAQQSPNVLHTYRLITESKKRSGALRKPEKGPTNCRFKVRALTEEAGEKIRKCLAKHGRGVLILGDSHAIDLMNTVALRFDEVFLVGLVRGGCRPNTNLEKCHFRRVAEFLEYNPDVFRHVIYEQAGFYLLQNSNGAEGSRKMFENLGPTSPVIGLKPSFTEIKSTLDYLRTLSAHSSVTWFGPRAEPHISKAQTFRKGCEGDFAFRPNQFETFENLDQTLRGLIQTQDNPNLSYVPQNDLLFFDLAKDFMDRSALYWSDGDHLSVAGEVRFGKRLPDDF